MSTLQHFTDALDTQYDESASKALGKDYWRVIDSFRFYLNDPADSYVEISSGYLTDGASVPRLFWSLLPPWGDYGQAAVVHDKLCETLTVVHAETGAIVAIDRAQADKAFKQAMEVLQVPQWKRNVMYIAVRV